MSRTITLLLLATLPGCIFYAHKDRGNFADDDEWTDDVDTDVEGPERPDSDRPVDTDVDDTDVVDSDTDVEDTDAQDGLTLDPDSAPVDSSTIVSILGDGTPDLREVVGVQVFGTGDVGVVAVSPRSAAEVLVTLTVPDDAMPGAQDVLVELEDGTAIWLPGAFTVTAP